MLPCAPPAVAHPPVLRSDWEALTRHASRWSKPSNLDACPASSSLHRFCGTTDKPKSRWFWGPNHQSISASFRAQTEKSTGFEAKLEKTLTTGFKVKPEKTVWVVLRSNHSQTIDLGYEAQPRNLRFSSPHARCRSHTVPPDLSITRPSSTWPMRPSPVLCTRSPSCHDPRHCTPCYTCHLHTTRQATRFSNKIENKGKTTKISRIQIQTSASQWLITIKPRNWPLGFS
jgi:hypothetical protein